MVASATIIQAAVSYRTKQSTYVALRANNDGNTVLSALRITATDPPTIASGWDVTRGAGGCGSPFATSTDGTSNMIVWVVGTEDHQTGGDQRLHGYDGDTGTVVYDGGGPNELMAGTHFTAPLALWLGDASMSPETTKCTPLLCLLLLLRPPQPQPRDLVQHRDGGQRRCLAHFSRGERKGDG